MKINASPYDEDTSTSILSFSSFEERERYLSISRSYWDILHSLKLSSLQFFKKFLGRQKITKNYTCRNWIWTFADDEEKGVLYCLVSKEGPVWEYDSRSDPTVIKSLFKEVNEYLVKKAGG